MVNKSTFILPLCFKFHFINELSFSWKLFFWKSFSWDIEYLRLISRQGILTKFSIKLTADYNMAAFRLSNSMGDSLEGKSMQGILIQVE